MSFLSIPVVVVNVRDAVSFAMQRGVLCASGGGIQIGDVFYEYNHTTTDGYNISFVHDIECIVPGVTINNRIVPQTVAVWYSDLDRNLNLHVDVIRAKWTCEWNNASSPMLPPRARVSGNPGIRLSTDGVVRKGKRSTKIDDEDEKDVVEESEDDMEDDEVDEIEGEEDEEEEKDVVE